MVNPMVNMSELQISLIAIGIVVVMGVILFNWLQQRRYRRHAEEAFGQKHEDVLLRAVTPAANDERIEPRLGTGTSPELQPDPDTKPDEPVEPVNRLNRLKLPRQASRFRSRLPSRFMIQLMIQLQQQFPSQFLGRLSNQFPNQFPN